LVGSQVRHLGFFSNIFGINWILHQSEKVADGMYYCRDKVKTKKIGRQRPDFFIN
jgi:hypothetical protein